MVTDRVAPAGAGEAATDDLGLRPLTARSVMASVLLGSHPPAMAVRSLVQVGDLFGIAEGTTRVALSRMVADGDLDTDDRHYRLGPRLAARQTEQDRGRYPEVVEWDGTWEIVVVTEAPGAVQRDRMATSLRGLHLAPTPPGTWLRPANLVRHPSQSWPDGCWRFAGRPHHGNPGDVRLARSLWDLDGWARRGEGLLVAFHAGTNPAERFVAAAASLRHLRSDPLLPAGIVGPEWPAGRLRDAYGEFEAELSAILTASSTSPRA